MDRRQMLKVAGAAVAGVSAFGLQAIANDAQGAGNSPRKKALIIGAHPDDPETGCGGTMILLRRAGYEVVSVYMTKGRAVLLENPTMRLLP